MDKQEAVDHLSQTDRELRDVCFELKDAEQRKKGFLTRLRQIDATAPPAEIERLRYLVGQCDLKMDIAQRRKDYLMRRGESEFKNIESEQDLRPWLKPKKPKM
ncbi:hypothetical protein ACQR1I_11690 [Bradyrhizobium sp. HKCCYLS2038]|uniref:hypothetical protein n=1 Tax=unclassified Bradyrhizobium TaxID=2631580 RepID=UPI003EB98645